MHHNSIVIDNFDIFNMEIFDSVFVNLDRYLFILHDNSFVDDLLRFHYCLGL